MTPQIRARLGTMMFVEYFIWGSWYVTVGTWLSKATHCNGRQIGLVAGATAIGAIVAPFFVGLVADRMFATEKVLAVLHIVGGALLLLASKQSAFTTIYGFILLYCLCFMPTLALTNSLSFRQMNDPKQEFGAVRVLGTAGWIVAGLFIGSMGMEATARPLQVASAASILMGLYCLSLPNTPPLARVDPLGVGNLFPTETLALLRDRPMAVFAATSFLICIPLQFYYAFTNLFFNNVGVHNAAGKMTGGQISELLCMLLIPWFFKRLGVKYMLAAAMSAWVLRYILFAYGGVGPRMWMFWGGILLHGICYDFFFVTGQIHIDRKASPSQRASAQGMIAFITYGLGMFVGSWLSGTVVDHYTLHISDAMLHYDWRSIWIVAAAAAALVLAVFLFAFSDQNTKQIDLTGFGREQDEARVVHSRL